MTVVAVDSTEPDLDHGQIGRGRYRVDRGAVLAEPADLRDLRPPPPPAARAGHRPRAEHRLRRRRRDRVPAALGRRPRPLRPQARAVRLAAGGHVHRQHRHGLVAPPAGQHAALLQRDRGRRPHVEVWRRYPYHGEERIIRFSTETLDYEKYTGAIEREVTTRDDMRAVARHRRRALRAGRARRARRAAVRVRRGRARRRHREAPRRRDYGVPLVAELEPASPSTRRRSSSTSPTSRCSAPRSGCALASRALALGAARTWAPTSGFDPPRFEPFGAALARRRSAPASASARRRSRASSRGSLARDRDVVVVAMGRGGPPEPELIEAPPTSTSCSRCPGRAATRRPTTWRPPSLPACVRRLPPLRRRPGRRRWRCSNVAEGARAGGARAARTSLVFDGSGAAVPPVAADARDPRRVGAAGADVVDRSSTRTGSSSRDLVVLTWPTRTPGSIREHRGPSSCRSIACDLRAAARSSRLRGRRTAVFTAGRARDRATSTRSVVHTSREPCRPGRAARGARAPSTPRSTWSSSRRPHRRRRRGRHGAGRRGRLRARTTSCRCRASPTSTRAADARRRCRVARRCRHERARAVDHLPLGGESGLPYSKGLLARALIATGMSATRACELALRVEDDLAQRGDTRARPRAPGGARPGRPRRERGRRRRCAGCAVPRAAAPRPPDRRCSSAAAPAPGSRASPPRSHYRLGITRVTSTDFIRQTMRAFFSRGVHAVDPLLELRGRAGAAEAEETRDPIAPRLPRPDAERARRRPSGDRACASRGLVDGARGRPPRPGHAAAVEGALAVQCVLEIEREDMHAGHFWVRDADDRGPAPGQRYLDALDDIRQIQASSSTARVATTCR